MKLEDLEVVAYGWENTMIGKSGLMMVQLEPGQYPDIPTKLVRLDDAQEAVEEERSFVAKYRAGNTALLEALMDMVHQHCSSVDSDLIDHGYLSANEDAVAVLEEAGMVKNNRLLWDALEARKPKQQTWVEAVNDCVSDPAERARLLAMADEDDGAYSKVEESNSRNDNGSER